MAHNLCRVSPTILSDGSYKSMNAPTVPTRTLRSMLLRIAAQEDLNFLLTNRIPRQLLTRFMGWFSQIEQPLVRDLSIAVWRAFCDVDLSDARKTHFRSMHDCFTRELRQGARPIDPRSGSSDQPVRRHRRRPAARSTPPP